MPLTTKRFSAALEPSIEMPPSFGSWLAPGAWVTSDVKSRPLGSEVDRVLPQAEPARALPRVHQRRGRRDADLLGDRRNLEDEREPFDLSEEHFDPLEPERSESGQRGRHVVIPRRERGKAERAGRVGDRRDRRTLRDVQRRDRGAWEHRALGVLNRAFNRTALLLRQRGLRHQAYRSRFGPSAVGPRRPFFA